MPKRLSPPARNGFALYLHHSLNIVHGGCELLLETLAHQSQRFRTKSRIRYKRIQQLKEQGDFPGGCLTVDFANIVADI